MKGFIVKRLGDAESYYLETLYQKDQMIQFKQDILSQFFRSLEQLKNNNLNYKNKYL